MEENAWGILPIMFEGVKDIKYQAKDVVKLLLRWSNICYVQCEAKDIVSFLFDGKLCLFHNLLFCQGLKTEQLVRTF